MIDPTFPSRLRATRVLTLATALVLPACELPSKSGDDGTTTGTTVDQPDTSDVTDPTTQADATFDGQTSEQPGECEALGEAECGLQAGCVAKHGAALDFPGCSPEPAFLGCLPDMACDAVLTTVCRDGTEEVYQNTDGCIPAGFTACDPGLGPCGGACLGLDEAACAANQACSPIHGHPHVLEEGMVCVDVMVSVFLACNVNDGACPPFVPTVCAVDEPDAPFDVPSGCIPSGFVECEGAGTPECL